MIYHLVTKLGTHEKVTHSFISSAFPKFEEYINTMSSEELNFITFESDELKKIENSIKSSLDIFFQNEYIEIKYGIFRPKHIRKYEYLGREYDLDMRSTQLRQIYLLRTIREVMENNSVLILFDESYHK